MPESHTAERTITEKAIIKGWEKKAELPNTIELLKGCAVGGPMLFGIVWAAMLGIDFLNVLFNHGSFWNFLFTLLVSLGGFWLLLLVLSPIITDLDHVERTYKACTELYRMVADRTDLSAFEKAFLTRITTDFKRPLDY